MRLSGPSTKALKAWYLAANEDDQIHIIYKNWVAALRYWRDRLFHNVSP